MGKSRSKKRKNKLNNTMNATKKLAKLLRTSEDVVLDLEKKMEKISKKKGVIDKIVQENESKVREKLIELGFGKNENLFDVKAEDVFEALVEKAKKDDKALLKYFYKPDFSDTAGCRSLMNAANELTGNLVGFYLKEEKAKEFLRLNPPKNIMASLGYGSDVDKMIENEDIFELFAALRFIENSEWLNTTFFEPYKDLKKDDFEKREIKVMALPERWKGIGSKFVGKKLHHMSHLKELGLVFVIPVEKQVRGEILYLFFMTLHYIYETDWHARLFESYSENKDFADDMINALKVGVTEESLPGGSKISWRIIPKYLAKKNINDPRLAEPHINPESWYYTRAAKAIKKFAKRFPKSGLIFWDGLEIVCDYFLSKDSKKETLVSFDLFDNGISLLQKAEFKSRFFYHQQEALWNEIFIQYLGENELDKIMMENSDKGHVTL